jgi:hypothetical protein
MTRVLFIIDHLGSGGVQEFLLNYCQRVQNQQVTVLSLFGNDCYSEALRRAGAEVVCLTPHRYGYRPILDPRSFLAFRTFAAKHLHRFDAVHIKLFAGFLYASLLGLYQDQRVSAGLDAKRRQLPLPLQILYFLFARRYRRFFLPPIVAEDYHFLGLRPEAMRPQHYFVTDRASDTPHRFPARYNLLTIGRCIGQKGHQDAIRFFSRLHGLLDGDAALHVIGDGPHLPRLRAAVPDSLKHAVHFLGVVDNLGDYMSACDAILKMTHAEGENSVVREAVLLGKPVLATLETENCRRLARDGLLIAIDREASDAALERARGALSAPAPDELRRRRERARALWSDRGALEPYLD